MPKSLRKQDEEAIGNLMNFCIDHLTERGQTGSKIYKDLSACYQSFEPGSNTVDTIDSCRNVLQSFDLIVGSTMAAELETLIITGVRSLNYPSSWPKSHRDWVATYMAAHPGTPVAAVGFPPVATWICPTAGGKGTPHQTLCSTATIEHIKPVVWHWNNYGHNQKKGDRRDWYYDFSNLEIICQSCNSSKSGSGQTYQIGTGPNYSN